MTKDIGKIIDEYNKLINSRREKIEKFLLKGLKLPKGVTVLVSLHVDKFRPIIPIISISVWDKRSKLDFNIRMRESLGLERIKRRFKLLLGDVKTVFDKL